MGNTSCIDRGFKLSVCLVTYNQEQYIEKCLRSILDQVVDFKFEIIVSDDCSKDGTRAVIEDFAVRYPGVVRVIHHEKNIGAYKNLVFVHHQASGEYIAHIDGDDFWLPGKLAAQISFLERHSECSAVYTNAQVLDVSDAHILNFNDDRVLEFIDIDYLIAKGNFLCASSLVYRSDFRDKVFLNKESVDYQNHINLAKCGLLGYCNKTYVAYRLSTPLSLVSTSGDIVRSMVYRAIRDSRNYISKKTLISAAVHCKRNEIFRCLRLRNYRAAISVFANSFFGEKLILSGFLVFLAVLLKILTKMATSISLRRERALFPRD